MNKRKNQEWLSFIFIIIGAVMASFAVALIILPNDAIDYGTAGVAIIISKLTKIQLSMLIGIPDYEAKSNREEGDGRPDIVLYPLNPGDPAYIFEIKTRRKYNEMDDGIQEAFGQIREKKYEEGILDDGYAGVISYGVCFCKKSCVVGLYQR